MKTILISLALAPLAFAQPAATGQYIFQKKVARGYEPVYLTPENGKVIGWSAGNLANVVGSGGSSAWADVTGKPAAVTALTGTNTGDQTLPTAASLGLVIGTNVQAYDADLTGWAAIAPASKADDSAVVKLTGNQNITGIKTLSGSLYAEAISAASLASSGAVSGTTITANTSFSGPATNVTGLPLTTGVTGVLPVANGGTGVSTATVYSLRIATAVEALSTTYVDAPTLVIPAGNYDFEFYAMIQAVGETSGGQSNFKCSPTTDDTIVTDSRLININALGTNGTAITSFRAGTNILNNADFVGVTYMDAPNNYATVQTRGSTVFASVTTVNFRIKQRTATDGSNAAKLLPGSFIKFTKLP